MALLHPDRASAAAVTTLAGFAHHWGLHAWVAPLRALQQRLPLSQRTGLFYERTEAGATLLYELEGPPEVAFSLLEAVAALSDQLQGRAQLDLLIRRGRHHGQVCWHLCLSTKRPASRPAQGPWLGVMASAHRALILAGSGA